MAAKLDSLQVVHVACSGGADSVFALLLLRCYLARQGMGDALRVLHFDHALRGEASAADAEFVRGLSAALRIPFLDARAEWGEGAGSMGEAEIRAARLRFFRKATHAAPERPAFVATGHHADDVVETLLMRLSRGAGLQGLCAPREISEPGGGLVFLRPVLDWGRDEIRRTLVDSGIPWREDESNASDGNYRARLRKQAIPAWEAASDRPVRPGAGRSRKLLAEDAEALRFAADRLWSSCWDDAEKALRRREVAALPLGLQRRLLLRLPGGAEVAAEAMDLALAAIESGEAFKLEVGRGLFYEFSPEWLRLSSVAAQPEAPCWPAFYLPVGAVAYLPDGARVSFSEVVLDESLRKKVLSGGNDDRRAVYLEAGGNSPRCLLVRTRAAGDAFKPHGKTSPKKLKNLFIDRKIDRRERDVLPVFVCETFGILWVPGFPPNADRTLGVASGAALRLTYER